MTLQPIGKALANDYRLNLDVGDAPNFIDSEVPLTPVVVVNNSFPRPSTKQQYRTYFIYKSGATSGDTQIESVSATQKIHFMGMTYYSDNASTIVALFDGTSGAAPTTTDGATNMIAYRNATGSGSFEFLTLPLQMKTGLRFTFSQPAGTTTRVVVHYIVETVE